MSEYRILGPNEVIQEGDEFQAIDEMLNRDNWAPVEMSVGYTPDECSQFKFRRKVEPAERQEYVLGFGFSAQMERVVLIRKTKPEWQCGKLNGIGGKIEDEGKYTAMVREFKEECGCQTHGQQWSYFCRMEGTDFAVHCFATVIDPTSCRTTEAEKVELISVSEIKHLQNQMVENLPWLIHLAVDHLHDSRPFFVAVAYDRADEPDVAKNATTEPAKEPTNIDEYCAQLEKERDEARSSESKLTGYIRESLESLGAAVKERDGWRAEAHRHITSLSEVCKERDELAAENVRLRESLERITVEFCADGSDGQTAAQMFHIANQALNRTAEKSSEVQKEKNEQRLSMLLLPSRIV